MSTSIFKSGSFIVAFSVSSIVSSICVRLPLVSVFSFFFFLANTIFFTHHWEMSGPSPPSQQINQIHYATVWEGGAEWDAWRSSELGCGLFTWTRRKNSRWNEDSLPGVSSLSNTSAHIHTRRRKAHTAKLRSMGIFFSHRAWHKEPGHQALSWLCVHYSGPHGSVSQPWGSCKLSTTLSTLPTSPSLDRSTWSLSQKSQCPSGVPGKLDKWRAGGGESRAASHPLLGFFSP